jgi:proteasome lid subunit RPN8/RPN11
MIDYLRSKLPNEAAGVISKGEWIPFANKSDNPTANFMVNDPLFDELYIKGEIDYLVHSHLNYAAASIADQTMQRALDIPFLIVNFNKEYQVDQIATSNSWEQPLIGRPFFFGLQDCLALCRDYTKLHYGVELPNPIREYGYWDKDIPMFEESISETGCADYIPLSEITIGDLVLYTVDSKVVNHIAVMVSETELLHHFIGKPSSYYRLSFLQKYATNACRIRGK